MANDLHFTFTTRGLADVEVTLDIGGIAAGQNSQHQLLVLPIRIEPTAYFEAPDNTEVTLLARGATHSVLSLLYSPNGQTLEFRILSAFDVYGTLDGGRARFSADTAYSNFVTHKSLLGTKNVVSNFDLTFEFSKDYDLGNLGFKPSSSNWSKSGNTWTINASNASTSGEVFIEFPDPFENSSDIAKIALNAILAIAVAIIAPIGLAKFRDNRLVLVLFVVIAGAGTAFFAYYLRVTPNPMASLVWGVTPFISLLLISITSLCYLVSSFFMVRVVGAVAIKDDMQRQLFFTKISVFEVTDSGEKLLKKVTIKVGGKFDFFVRIGRAPKKVKVLSEVDTFKSAYSQESMAEVGKPTVIDTMYVESV